MKLLIIRHGDPDYARDHLTKQGCDEARALAAYLKVTGVHRIFSSPLGRARATAEYTAQAVRLPVTIEPWSAELSLHASQLNLMAWDVHAHLLGEERTSTEAIRPYLTDEEYSAVLHELERVRVESDHFLANLGFHRAGGHYEVFQPNCDRIAFFCHGGFGLTWLAVLLHIPVTAIWGGFFLPTTSITEILFDERVPGLATARCVGLGTLPHLAMAGLVPGTSGLKANHE